MSTSPPFDSRMPRRAFLQAAGTLIALPIFDSLLPRAARAAATPASPQRLITFFAPCGFNMTDFTPTTSGANFPMTPILQPLTALQNYVTVPTGLTNHAAQRSIEGAGGGAHGQGCGTFGNCNTVAADGTYNRGGTTFDQLAANFVGMQTRIPSLQLTSQFAVPYGSCDSGFLCAYEGTISWADSQTPLMPTAQPSAVFNAIFGSGNVQETEQQAAQRILTRKSILDGVLNRIGTLRGKLNSTDQIKLDQYLTSLREVEREVTVAPPAACGTPTSPTDPDPNDFPTLAQAMVNLMTLAVQCDATRVVSMMLGYGGSDFNCSFLSYNGGSIGTSRHTLSHLVPYYGDTVACYGAISVVNTWSVSMLAQFATALHNTAEGEGNMLDNTLIYMGSEISDGSLHNHDNMPVLLVGKGGGAYAGNRNIVYSNNESLADLYLYMLQSFGVPVTSFGADGAGDNGTVPLAGLV